MGLLSSVGSVFGALKKNKQTKKQRKIEAAEREFQQAEVFNQYDIGKRLEDAAAPGLQQRTAGFDDGRGGTVTYDPVANVWRTNLSGTRGKLQDASDAEQLNRYTTDAAQERTAFQDSERQRMAQSAQGDAELARLNDMYRGVGVVDPNAVAAKLRLGRRAAVDAGFDSAADDLAIVGQRTGSSAIADALAKLARERSRTALQAMGDPELEAMNAAESINSNRRQQQVDTYGAFADRGRTFDTRAAFDGYKGGDALGDANFKQQEMNSDMFKTGLAGVSGNSEIRGNASAARFSAVNKTPFRPTESTAGIFLKGADAVSKDLASAFGKGL